MHCLNGNISMKELMDVMQKLGLNQPWIKDAAKALLQDTARKQRAHDFLQQGMLYEIGRLVHDTPIASGPSSSAGGKSSGGKGAGKGKGSQNNDRTPWHNLEFRPSDMFVDTDKKVVQPIPKAQVNAIAKGVFLAGTPDFEAFLSITSNNPLAMITPQSARIRESLQSNKARFAERLVAFHDPRTGQTTPKQVFLVQLGSSVHFAESTPDAQFDSPPDLAEVAVEIEIDKVDNTMQQQIDKNPRWAFKQIMIAALSEGVVMQVYSVSMRADVLQGIIKVPASQLANVLSRSGPDGIFLKEKFRQDKAIALPLALIHHSHLMQKDFDQATLTARALPHFCGIHRSSTGSKSLRFRAEGIAKARSTLCTPGLFTDENIHVVANKYFQVQGLPSGTSASAVANGLRQWGWTTIPIKTWPLSYNHAVWLVGAADEPPGDFLSLQNATVTIVKDGIPLTTAPPPTAVPLQDPLQLNDPWARVQKATLSPTADPPIRPPAPTPTPKVQAVVESRIVEAEARMTEAMQTLVQSLREDVTREVTSLREAQSTAQQQLVETVTQVKSMEVTLQEQVREFSQQQQSMEARLLEAITSSSAKPSPPRKMGRN
jgi:hypothetical protein